MSVDLSVNETIRLDEFDDEIGPQRIVDLICALISSSLVPANGRVLTSKLSWTSFVSSVVKEMVAYK